MPAELYLTEFKPVNRSLLPMMNLTINLTRLRESGTSIASISKKDRFSFHLFMIQDDLVGMIRIVRVRSAFHALLS